jgi:hypothetical protein
MTDRNCRCPVRPYATLGSFASGSTSEEARLRVWQVEHGNHPYAKARDELAGALQQAEGKVGTGPAVLDMVHDVFGVERRAWDTRHVLANGGSTKTIRAESEPGFGSDTVTVQPSGLSGCVQIHVTTPRGTQGATLDGRQAQALIDAIREALPDPVQGPAFTIG